MVYKIVKLPSHLKVQKAIVSVHHVETLDVSSQGLSPGFTLRFAITGKAVLCNNFLRAIKQYAMRQLAYCKPVQCLILCRWS